MPEYLTASDWTLTKQESYRSNLKIYTAIASAIAVRHKLNKPWFYCDLTAASGLVQTGDHFIDGSPLIALKTFRDQYRFRIHCVFVEYYEPFFASLAQNIAAEYATWNGEDRGRITYQLFQEDHREVLRSLRINNGYGLLYWDGLGGDIYPSRDIGKWLKFHPYQDLLVMASGTAQKRSHRPRLDRMLLTVPKNYHWLTEPYGPWQWVFALASNWSELGEKMSPFLKLFDAFSPKGKMIRDILGLTKEQFKNRDQTFLYGEFQTYGEYLRSPKFREIREKAFQIADRLCERCGAPATEVHHLRYPASGEYDTPDNLLVLCHSCHCWVERKLGLKGQIL